LCAQQLRQLNNIRRNPLRLVFGQKLGRRSPPRLVLEIDIGERLSAVIADDKVGSGGLYAVWSAFARTKFAALPQFAIAEVLLRGAARRPDARRARLYKKQRSRHVSTAC
jgi:hypothetical protein